MIKKKKPVKIWVEKWENDIGIRKYEWKGIWRNVHYHMLSPYDLGNSSPQLHVRIFCNDRLQQIKYMYALWSPPEYEDSYFH